MQLVCVVLNCGPMFEDCMRLMSDGFARYPMTQLLSPQRVLGEVPVLRGRVPKIRVYSYNPFSYPLRADENADIEIKCEIKRIAAPVKRGQEVGRVNVYLKDELLHTDKIYSMDEVRGITVAERMQELLNGE
jgi:D-alanyl-D-alanine carboxypeptidase